MQSALRHESRLILCRAVKPRRYIRVRESSTANPIRIWRSTNNPTTTTTNLAKCFSSNTTNTSGENQSFSTFPWDLAILLLAGITTVTMVSDSEPRNVMLQHMRSLKGRSLHDKYKIDWDVILGEGAYGSVHPARLSATGEKVALKQISRGVTNAIGFKTETDALLRIYDNGGHPNISGLRDMYEDHKYYYLILDLVSGGEMFEHLVSHGAYSEADAARLMHEIASALAFLHGVGVVHCDLKPENLLLSTKNRLDGTIKMIDFGCAILIGEDDVPVQQQKSSTGTTAYWSPERFSRANRNKDVAAAVDMVSSIRLSVEASPLTY